MDEAPDRSGPVPMQTSEGLDKAPDRQSQSHAVGGPAVSNYSNASPSHPPIMQPEANASGLLEQEEINRQQLCQLLHAVCQDSSNESEAGKFFAGMYRHGGVAGLRKNCRLFPCTIRAINQFIAQQLDVTYNALVVLDNVASPMHRDTMNAPAPNWIIPVGEFLEGGVWQQDPNGSVVRHVQGKPSKGIILDVSQPAALHAAECFHQTEPWQGDRLIIVVYTLQMEESLSASDARQLMALGFPLPLSTGQCAASPAPAEFASLDPTATGVPLVLGVFAGSARITHCCRQLGLRADAIDHKPHALSKVEPLLLDLTTPEGKRVLRGALAHPDLKAVWWAPPCGTAS